VSLLLVESIVGDDHQGFRELLTKAKAGLNKPWLGTGLTQADVQKVDAGKREALDTAFVLATRIADLRQAIILPAEGSCTREAVGSPC
jgi:hypothetical protein